jgi:predicted phosphohydrolase
MLIFMRAIWLTDLHLSFALEAQLKPFVGKLMALKPDALFVTGDTGEAGNVSDFLMFLASKCKCPVYFVFGNHDFYSSSIRDVRRWGKEITKSAVDIHWMPAAELVKLSETVGLVGVDGWGDAQFGDPLTSRVTLADWIYIKELRAAGGHPGSYQGHLRHVKQRVPLLRKLGTQEAASLRGPLTDALEAGLEQVYVLTHVPPYEGATWHDGEQSDPAWMPWFSCKAVGDLLDELGACYPETQITVLCGHTHGKGYYRRSDNIEVFTGGATYRQPEIQKILTIE